MSDRAYAAYTTHELRDLVRKEAPEEGGENLVRLCLELIEEIDHLRADVEVGKQHKLALSRSLTGHEQRLHELSYRVEELLAQNSVLINRLYTPKAR